MTRSRTVSLVLIIAALLCVTAVLAQRSFKRNRERVLRSDLYWMRYAIDQYTLTNNHTPQSLNDLVRAGYAKQLPIDPMTKSRDTWVAEHEDAAHAVDKAHPGVVDVHSASKKRGLNGEPYCTW